MQGGVPVKSVVCHLQIPLCIADGLMSAVIVQVAQNCCWGHYENAVNFAAFLESRTGAERQQRAVLRGSKRCETPLRGLFLTDSSESCTPTSHLKTNLYPSRDCSCP